MKDGFKECEREWVVKKEENEQERKLGTRRTSNKSNCRLKKERKRTRNERKKNR